MITRLRTDAGGAGVVALTVLLVTVLTLGLTLGLTMWLAPGSIRSAVDALRGDRAEAAQSPAALPSPEPGITEQVDSEQACMAKIPLKVRIGQTMLVILTDPERARSRLSKGWIAGFMANGIVDSARAQAFKNVLDTASGPAGGFLAADEEGGQVQRYSPVTTVLPSASYQAQNMTPEQVRQMYAAHGKELLKWGVSMAMAPSLDVGYGPGIGNRSYSDDPKVVATYGTAAAEGYMSVGVTPVVKHFPGHGQTTGDTHLGPATGPDLATIRKRDLVPFTAVIRDVPGAGVMASHVITPGLSDKPASQSEEVITGLLRGELGFTGLVVGDALGMAGSMAPDQGTALVRFLQAGGDLGIIGIGGSKEGMAAVLAAVEAGELTEERINDAALKTLHYKNVDPCSLVAGSGLDFGGESERPVAGESDTPIINPTLEATRP